MSRGLSLCRQTQTETAEREGEREGGRLTKPSFYYSEPHCLPGRTYLITDVTRKTWGSSNATNPSSTAPPPSPAPNRSRALTAQHAVQISSGSEITEHLSTSVELFAGARQLSGPASCRLTSLLLYVLIVTRDGLLFSSILHQRWLEDSFWGFFIYFFLPQGLGVNWTFYSHMKNVSRGTS